MYHGDMSFEPRVYFITPVHRRFALTRACLEQRVEMLAALPFEAHAVIVGDDDNMQTAADLGLITVKKDNKYVSAKFNAGYEEALERGATHMMPVGSDSFLHQDAFLSAEWEERGALGLIGLSAVSPWGNERLDLAIKYPAGFGVGMVYPEWAIRRGGGADPHKNAGIDTSTWARCGRGMVQIAFQEIVPQAYVNFCSPDTQITSYESLRGVHARRAKVKVDPWADLITRYGRERVEAVQGVYAAHALGVLLTGHLPVLERAHMRNGQVPNLPGHRGRKPVYRAPRRGSTRREDIIRNFEDLR